MTSLWLRRHLPRFIAVVIVLVLGIVGIRMSQDFAPQLMVLCSNNEDTCHALVRGYERSHSVRTQVVRMPTSEALAYVRSSKDRSEFDVWVGGPAEAYVLADRDGLLTEHNIETSHIPASMTSPTWIGTYGGVLSFCVGADSPTPHTWNDLAAYPGRLALPLPFTSGTAATMLTIQHERGADLRYLRALHDHATVYTSSGTDPARLVALGRVDAAVTFEAYCPTDASNPRAPHLIIPQDGTGYEVGAGAVLAHGRNAAGRDFLSYVVSQEGQHITASAENQNPVSLVLPDNLSRRLAHYPARIYTENIVANAAIRERLLTQYANEIMYPDGVAGPLWRSLRLSFGGALVATLVGGLLALTYRLHLRGRILILIAACGPILVPSVAISSALTQSPLALDPYDWPIVVATFAICGTPLAFVIFLALTSNITTSLVMSAADAGASPTYVLRRLYVPRLWAPAGVSIAAVTLWFMNDNSAGAAYGGRDHAFINMALSALPLGTKASVAVLVACGGLALAGAVLTWVALTYFPVSHRYVVVRSRAPHRFLARFFARERALLAIVVVVWVVLMAYVVAVMWQGIDTAAVSHGMFVRLGVKLWLGVAVTCVAVVVGVALAIRGWVHPNRVHAVMVFVLLSAPIGIGLLMTMLFRHSVDVSGVPVFPALVGGYSFGSGSIAVIVAYLAVAIPLAYFFAILSVRPVMHMAQVARDLGASRVRTLVVVLAHARGRLVALTSVVFGVTLTQTATLAFVQPAYLAVSARDMVSLAEHGRVGEIYAAALSAGGIAAVLMVIGTLGFFGRSLWLPKERL